MELESLKATKHQTSINEIFQAQKATCISWRQESLKPRRSRLKRVKRWVEDHRQEIREAIYLDFKKPPEEVDLSEIYVVLSEIKHALAYLDKWAAPRKVEAPLALMGSNSQIHYQPKGVCLIISPWNFPFNLSIAPMVSALAAGNTVMLKPSEMTPNCTGLIKGMISDLFQPSEVAVFEGGKETATELLKLPFDHIFFTGSPAVGKIVMEAAAKNLSSVTLELGGKSPVIIDSSADLRDASEKIAWSKFINCGQTCIAPDYLLIHENVHDAFLDELRISIDRLFDGEGTGIEHSKAYARIINQDHFYRLKGLIDQAMETGGELEIGGNILEEDLFISPTVISNPSHEADLLRQEIFGPILPVVKFQQLEDCLEFISERPNPLALYVFSRASSFQKKVLNETSSGSAAINDCVVQFMNPNLPFGGTKTSGFGKSHGFYGFQAFSNQKSVLKQKVGLTSVKPIYPPYGSITKKAIEILVKYF